MDQMTNNDQIDDLDIKMFKLYHKSDERDDQDSNNVSYASLNNEVFSLRNLLEKD
jgi:hypothetical protein